jgi:hypothetical protein
MARPGGLVIAAWDPCWPSYNGFCNVALSSLPDQHAVTGFHAWLTTAAGDSTAGDSVEADLLTQRPVVRGLSCLSCRDTTSLVTPFKASALWPSIYTLPGTHRSYAPVRPKAPSAMYKSVGRAAECPLAW